MFLVAKLALILMAGSDQATSVQQAEKPTLKCDTGPVPKVFGGTDWLVYSCSDLSTMAVVSVKENPASPFYFILSKKEDGYRIYGEGNGDKTASDKAGDDLSRLNLTQLNELLAETQKTAAR